MGPAQVYRTQTLRPYPGRMSVSAELATPVGVAQPRRMVIDSAWRGLGPGVEVLSAGDGGPLTRTVKRILDPLVLRLRVNTQFSAPVVEPDVAAEMAELITSHGTQLRSTAAWFALLKQHRRRLRITSGNAQELYFPICFELAVTRGAPGADDHEFAASTLAEIHGDRDRTGTEVLNTYISDARTVDELARQLKGSWADIRATGTIADPFLAGLTTVLGHANSHNAEAARQRVWSVMIADATPFNLGADARIGAADLPWSIVSIGLSSAAPQQPPPVVGDGGRDRPLDRSVVDRVRATLRRALDRDELPDIPLLCAEEVDRACAPWGLLGEDKQATLVAGIEVAVQLAPLSDDIAPTYPLAAAIQARLRKEAYVLHARRYLAGGQAIHPRQQQVVDDLGAFARPYLSRLWARLHGRDVWQEPCEDVQDMRTLLEGVARSVSLDHRQRIKAMLQVSA